jgi:hypothetical protein
MNNQLTPPPDHDLHPATRNRHRDELIAIVDHESAQGAPRRRLVPLAAAAAIVAVTAGLAIAVPALRGEKTQPPVSGPDIIATTPAVEPLTTAEKTSYAESCNGEMTFGRTQVYTVTEAFKWVNPAASTQALSWVLIKRRHSKGLPLNFQSLACGFNAKGTKVAYSFGPVGGIQMDTVNKTGAGNGTYAKPVARITIAIGTGPATEAILRHGFFFAPMKYFDTPRRDPSTPPTYTVRGYDANGNLIYASPKTEGELQARLDGCFTNPEGTKVVFAGGGKNGTPPVSQCARGVSWNW